MCYEILIVVLSLFFSLLLLQPFNFSPVSFACNFQNWGCVILREIDFLLKICWSIPCIHPSWKVHTKLCFNINLAMYDLPSSMKSSSQKTWKTSLLFLKPLQMLNLKRKKCGDMAYYAPPVWKSGGTRPPVHHQIVPMMASEQMPNPGLPMWFFENSYIDSPKKIQLSTENPKWTQNLVNLSTFYHIWPSVNHKTCQCIYRLL